MKAINELGSRLADEGAERLTRFDPAGFRELLMGEFEAADAEGARLSLRLHSYPISYPSYTRVARHARVAAARPRAARQRAR